MTESHHDLLAQLTEAEAAADAFTKHAFTTALAAGGFDRAIVKMKHCPYFGLTWTITATRSNGTKGKLPATPVTIRDTTEGRPEKLESVDSG